MRARLIATSTRRLGTTSTRRLGIFAAVVLVAAAVGACGQQSHPTAVDGEQEYVAAGPITYQVQLSRQLNPNAVDDRQLLAGAASAPPLPTQLWFGVWMWAKNQSSSKALTTDSFAIVDSAGDKYYPVPINTRTNPFVWTAQPLAPTQIQPAPGTAAGDVPPQGGLVLFKLNDTVFSNRPLTLQIYARGQSQPSTVSLDL